MMATKIKKNPKNNLGTACSTSRFKLKNSRNNKKNSRESISSFFSTNGSKDDNSTLLVNTKSPFKTENITNSIQPHIARSESPDKNTNATEIVLKENMKRPKALNLNNLKKAKKGKPKSSVHKDMLQMEQMAKYTDTNMEQLQMAIALSKSTNEDQEDINKPYPSTQNIAENVRLELFGFRINLNDGKTSKVVDNSQGKLKKKKGKFRFRTPTLCTRTNEEREKIITNNISQIITTSMDYFQQFDKKDKQEKSDLIPFSPSLQEFYVAEKICFQKSQQTLNDVETYYVTELDIPKCKTIYGSLLRRWDSIPGRQSPNRNKIIDSGNQDDNKLGGLKEDYTNLKTLIHSMDEISNEIPRDLAHISPRSNSPDVLEISENSSSKNTSEKDSTHLDRCENMTEQATKINTFSELNVVEGYSINDNGICHYERFSDSEKYEDADNEVILAFNSDDEEECPQQSQKLPISSDNLSDKDSNHPTNTLLDSSINMTRYLSNEQLVSSTIVKHNSLISNNSTLSTEDSIYISDEELNYSSINNFVKEKQQENNFPEKEMNETKHEGKMICIDISLSDSDTEMHNTSQNLMSNEKLNDSFINGAKDLVNANTTLNSLTQDAKKSFKSKFEISDSDITDNESDISSVGNRDENVKAIIASLFAKTKKQVQDDVISLSDSEDHLSINSSPKEMTNYQKEYTLVENMPEVANIVDSETNGIYNYYDDDMDIYNVGTLDDNDQTLRAIDESNTLNVEGLLDSTTTVRKVNSEKYRFNYEQDDNRPTESDEFDEMLMKESIFYKASKEKLQHPRVKELSQINTSTNRQSSTRRTEIFNDTTVFNDTRLSNNLENEITACEENQHEAIITEINQDAKDQSPIRDGFNTPESSRYGLSVKTRNITPMPHYKEMSTPQIHEELNKIGVKPLKRPRGIDILMHVYNSTHLPLQRQTIEDENGLPIAKRRKRLEYDELNELSTPAISNLRIELNDQIAESEDLHEIILERKVSKRIASCALPFHIAWHNFLCVNPEIRESILLYEPLQIETIYEMFKLIGFKYHIQDMIAFFDRKCITIKIQRK